MRRSLVGPALALILVVSACAPAAAPSPTVAPSKPAATSAPAGKPAESKPAESKPAAAPAAKSEGMQKVTLRLDWIVVGNNVMYYLAKDKGFYAQEGLDVEIGPGKGSTSTSQVVGSGGDMFGIADVGTAAVAIGRGVPLTVLASFVQKSPITVTVLEESGIKTPKDLKGKRVGAPPGSATTALLPAFLEANGMSRNDVTPVNIDPAALWSSLVEGKVDAIAVFVTADPVVIEVKTGKQVRNFMYADSGVNVLSTGVIVNNDLMKSNPDLMKKFLRATIRGWEYSQQHPDEAVEAGLKRNESGDREVFKRQLTDTFPLLHTDNTKGKPLGWMAEEDWKDSLALLKKYLELQGDRPAKELYSNEFLPQP